MIICLYVKSTVLLWDDKQIHIEYKKNGDKTTTYRVHLKMYREDTDGFCLVLELFERVYTKWHSRYFIV